MNADIILNHSLVPKHSVLSKADAKKILDELKVTMEQLPKISIEDPVIKAIGGKKGDIIKIIRQSLTAGEAVYYRVVI